MDLFLPLKIDSNYIYVEYALYNKQLKITGLSTKEKLLKKSIAERYSTLTDNDIELFYKYLQTYKYKFY